MKILFTGASSFTGFWFARALATDGHDVLAIFQGAADSYSDVRGERVRLLKDTVACEWEVQFGTARFLELAGSQDWDVLCHHAADVTNYRSPNFDYLAAAHNNTLNMRAVLDTLTQRGCGKLICTGSIFEPYEGIGDSECRAFSPYGLSKHLSFEITRLEAETQEMGLGKFIVPNPFGAYEEPRFTAYLMREWGAGRAPAVATPEYIRDNIHVDLLARAYAAFCAELSGKPGTSKLSPSGYLESQGQFAQRCAREIGSRISRPLSVELKEQTEFPEPKLRVASHPASPAHPDWSEKDAWDGMVDYYGAIGSLSNSERSD